MMLRHVLRNQITALGLTCDSTLHITAPGSPSSGVIVAQSLLVLFVKTIVISEPRSSLAGSVALCYPVGRQAQTHPLQEGRENTFLSWLSLPLRVPIRPGKREGLRAHDLTILPADRNDGGEMGGNPPEERRTLLSSIRVFYNVTLSSFHNQPLDIQGHTSCRKECSPPCKFQVGRWVIPVGYGERQILFLLFWFSCTTLNNGLAAFPDEATSDFFWNTTEWRWAKESPGRASTGQMLSVCCLSLETSC